MTRTLVGLSVILLLVGCSDDGPSSPGQSIPIGEILSAPINLVVIDGHKVFFAAGYQEVAEGEALVIFPNIQPIGSPSLPKGLEWEKLWVGVDGEFAEYKEFDIVGDERAMITTLELPYSYREGRRFIAAIQLVDAEGNKAIVRGVESELGGAEE